MKYWVGLIALAAGAWLIFSALQQRRQVLEIRRRTGSTGDEVAEANPSLSVLGAIMPPIIILGLLVAGVQSALAYAVLGAGELFSLFDLLGFLFLLAAYGTWLILKTRYRQAEIDAASEALASERERNDDR